MGSCVDYRNLDYAGYDPVPVRAEDLKQAPHVDRETQANAGPRAVAIPERRAFKKPSEPPARE